LPVALRIAGSGHPRQHRLSFRGRHERRRKARYTLGGLAAGQPPQRAVHRGSISGARPAGFGLVTHAVHDVPRVHGGDGMLSDRRAVDPQATERGFSLLELLVAMVVTLIVTGAIYGLLASGQTAFRREPLLTERQQNIRAAMEMMQADVN